MVLFVHIRARADHRALPHAPRPQDPGSAIFVVHATPAADPLFGYTGLAATLNFFRGRVVLLKEYPTKI